MPQSSKTEKKFSLTAKQKEGHALLSSEALFIMLFGGSRSAKTFLIVRTIVLRALLVPKSRHAILRFRFSHIKASVIYDTFPKVMELAFPGCPYKLNKSDWYVKFPNGSEIWFGGLDDKQRTEKILGNEYATIFLNECSQITYAAYLTIITRLAQLCHYDRKGKKYELRLKLILDENPPSKSHWSHVLFIDKKDPETKREVTNPEDYASMLMNPKDNIENLPATYIKALKNLPRRKRDRFWSGLFGSDEDTALWTLDCIEKAKVTEAPEMQRIVIAVDPSGADDDPDVNNDDIGIIAMGLGTDGNAYCLEDGTMRGGPGKWAAAVASIYDRHGADRVVAEVNYGGAMVEATIRVKAPNISYKAVRAARAKHIRAEPISALMEEGKLKLVGDFPDLEDELMGFTTSGYSGVRSPNRADAFVFAAAELFPAVTRIEQAPPKLHLVPKVNRLKRAG